MDNRAVGVMDSGVGGLTVARVLAEKYPKEGIIFLGDTARNPYGERPVEEIVRFSEAIKDFLLKKDVKMILVACNTISFNVPPSFLEGDVPVIKMSMNVALPEDAKKIAVFATPATISAHSHKKYLAKAHPEVETVEIPCEGLAAAIERNEDKNSIRALLQSILKEYDTQGADTALLACTHFPLVEDVFKEVLSGVRFLDPALPTVEDGMKILREKGALADKKGEKHFYFTAGEDRAAGLVNKIFGMETVEKAHLLGV